jgi:hypothetical protein
VHVSHCTGGGGGCAVHTSRKRGGGLEDPQGRGAAPAEAGGFYSASAGRFAHGLLSLTRARDRSRLLRPRSKSQDFYGGRCVFVSGKYSILFACVVHLQGTEVSGAFASVVWRGCAKEVQEKPALLESRRCRRLARGG